MERERPEVDAALDRLFASHGYGVRRPDRVEPNQVLGATPRAIFVGPKLTTSTPCPRTV